MMGRKGHWLGKNRSDETKRKISLVLKGRKLSEETKKKMRLSLKGRIFSEEHKNKLRGRIPWNKYKPLSKEHKKKISLANKGKSSKNKGKPLSKETKKKLSLALSGEKNYLFEKHLSDEIKNKISLAKKGKCMGKDSPSWKGGLSFEPYTYDFNKRFKERIKERDNYCCVVCNIHQIKLKYPLSIHHINYNKLNSLPQNCVALCINHHSETNNNRTQWKLFFQSLLKERYNYQYSEDQKIILDFTK